MNEIDAVTRRLVKPMLLFADFSQLCERWPEIAECFQSEKAYALARGRLENGDAHRYRTRSPESLGPQLKNDARLEIAPIRKLT